MVFITYHKEVELDEIISVVKDFQEKSSFCLFKRGGEEEPGLLEDIYEWKRCEKIYQKEA